MNKEKHRCSYDIDFTEEERDALSWLSSLVARGAETCGPEAQQFHVAHNAMEKLLEKGHELHDLLHKRDAELRRAETITTGLLGLSRTVRENETVN